MRLLKCLRFDAVCRRAAAAMLVCVAVLIVCGCAPRGSFPAAVAGDIAACAVISLYACTLAYALCSAVSGEAGCFGEFVLRSGHIFCASCAAAQALKLFFLLLPSNGAELIGGVVLIADTAVSWILPMKILKNRRNVFYAEMTEKIRVG